MRVEHLRDYLPHYYRGPNAPALLDAQETELRTTEAKIARVDGDMLPETALDIERWEQEYNVVPIPGQTLEERQQAVAVAILGGGTFTKAKVEDIARVYFPGFIISVAETPDAFLVQVRLHGPNDTHEGEAEFMRTIYKPLPAHATLELFYVLKLWRDLFEAKCWDDMRVTTWGEARWVYWFWNHWYTVDGHINWDDVRRTYAEWDELNEDNDTWVDLYEREPRQITTWAELNSKTWRQAREEEENDEENA